MNNDDFGRVAISIEQAHALIRAHIKSIQQSELIGIDRALGRVLHQAVTAPVHHPPTDNAAMDGYALRFADVATLPCQLDVIGQVLAGRPFNGEIGAGQAVCIMTGAVLPQGADTVVAEEQTTALAPVAAADPSRVSIAAIRAKGQHIRRQGEDIEKGQTVLPAGHRLTPGCIAALATIGVAEVKVVRQIKVGIVSTGDELQPLGTTLAFGQIYDCNRHALAALLHDSRFAVRQMPALKDDKTLMQAQLQKMATQVDMILTTGGVSVGAVDFIKDCIAQLGEVIFWKVNIKPGRPVMFGKISQTPIMGLPGNPVSAMLTYRVFADLALQQLIGQRPGKALRLSALLQSDLQKSPGRVEFQRGMMYYDGHGQMCVKSTGPQSSGMISSMARANCFIVLGHDEGNKSAGQMVTIEPLSLALI